MAPTSGPTTETNSITPEAAAKTKPNGYPNVSDGISIPKTCFVPQDWTPEFQRFVGAEFEAHIVPCKLSGASLFLETIPNTSSDETDEGGAL